MLSIHPEIASAKTLNTDFYLNPDLFAKARERIFSHGWQMAGEQSLVPNPQDVFPFTLLENFLDEPLVLTRDKEGNLHCLSNVCTHRGNILAEKACHSANLRCRYHGRIFQLDGSFHSMPEFKEVKYFPTEADNLKALPVFNWDRWLFVSLENSTDPHMYFKPMMDRMAWLPFKDFIFRPDLSKTYHVKAHWALYCENYLEGFHIPFVHAGLNDEIDYNSYSTELAERSSVQIAYAKKDADSFDLPQGSHDHGKRISAYYFFVFPNMMFNFYPWGLSINVVQPQDISNTRVQFYTYVWDESKRQQGAGADLERVELEDEEVVQNVQKGIRSRFYTHGRYSDSKETGVHHFHQLIAEAMK